MTAAAGDQTLGIVRDRVRKLLTRSPSYWELPPERRRTLANQMVKVARYVVDANGETAGTPMSAVISTGLDDGPAPAGDTQGPVATGLDRGGQVLGARDQRTAGQRFQQGGGAAAGQSGAGTFTDMIRRVNFPQFVAGLVDGVFNAIVTSSIKQMEAYSELVANVAKSVDEYMRDNITENQARDYLAGRYPQHLQVDTRGGQPRLVPRGGRGARGGRGDRGRGGRGGVAQSLAGGGAQSELPDFMKDLGLPEPIQRLDAKTAEEQLVPAARRRMAMDRQQLLATMVLMGINRLIVTDGKISASCLFTLDTTDAVTEDTRTASSFDEHTETTERGGWRFWFIPTRRRTTTADFSVSTTQDTSSTAEVNMHAQLAGNVDINFRSETFPLERMADILQIQEIEQKAPAAAPAAAPGAPRPPINLPPPPALPPLPGTPGAQPAQPAQPAAPPEQG
ncbi:MAG TPA: hypothetical protein VGV57_06315 [Thermoleophilaceae bacterium]|nr:hypothetical protein [Thermoleophilaceae bacterium]